MNVADFDDDSSFDDEDLRADVRDKVDRIGDDDDDDSLDDEWNKKSRSLPRRCVDASSAKDSEWDSACDLRTIASTRAGAKSDINDYQNSCSSESKERSPEDGAELIENVVKGAFEKVEMMLEKDPRCHEHIDAQGWSPLMHAVEQEDLSMFILLVSNGANVAYINKKNGFNVLQLAKSTQMNLMCKRAVKGFQLLDPMHFKEKVLNPKKYVAMVGQVEQERVRGTKSVVKGFIKMVWKEIQMVICGKEISLWKTRYGEDEIIAYLDLVDVEEFGTLSIENGFYLRTGAGHIVQFRVSSSNELAAWLFAFKHNQSEAKRVDDIPYSSKASWEVHWAS